ncbi:hypothetical protein [Roseivirga sp. E12]|uniref:hypothetical protein n=1 Tax=Roseivirga sp. E12 TaxID=2819237 RepID=UPI001ABC473E|nr:hypothetical protein [Roseivirga sp. E12]MBO3697713.1 hypothetical protein [Roseivirga sp. E12]
MTSTTTRSTNRVFSLLCTVLILVSLFACGEDIDDFTSAFQNEELKVHLDSFDAEVSNRGGSLDLSRVELVFIADIFFNGQRVCSRHFENYENQGNARIEISRHDDCWESRNDQQRENFLFREFGAALLDRLTNNTKLPNGLPASMMCNDCDIFSIYDESTIVRREYYLNELIQIEQDIPEWGR